MGMLVSKYKYRMLQIKAPKCPRCGEKVKVKPTQYGIRNECCGLWSWGEGNGDLVDADHHNCRKEVHQVIQQYVDSGRHHFPTVAKRIKKEFGIRVKDLKWANPETVMKVIVGVRGWSECHGG